MRIVDISQGMHAAMPVYPGDPPYASEPVCSFESGGDCEVSRISMSTHCGTHIDAPSHMLPDTEAVDQVPLARFIGACRVVTLPRTVITGSMIEELCPVSCERLLLRTDPTGAYPDRGVLNPAALDLDAARLLVQRGICLIGIDSLSIENMERTGGEVHRTLLGAGVSILEGLDLRQAEQGMCCLCAFPLKLEGENGSPCRAVLIYE